MLWARGSDPQASGNRGSPSSGVRKGSGEEVVLWEGFDG